MTGDVVFDAPRALASAIDRVVERSVVASRHWSAATVPERAGILHRFADLVEREQDDLAVLITRETGKRIGEAEGEVAWTALSARYYADHPPVDADLDGARVTHRPLGVIAAITPWNVPLVTPAWKWLPALVAGNSVLWKPSELASGVAMRAHQLLIEAGVPSDVVQLVLGDGEVGAALCGDARVDGVHFTGSTEAGRRVAALTVDRFARTALEMGGNNVAIVLADADVDAAADAIVGSMTAINGQKCTATRWVAVDRQVHAQLRDALSQRVASLTPGDPRCRDVTLGPLISPGAVRRAGAAVTAALDRGGRVLAHSPAVADDVTGAHARATIVEGLAVGDEAEREEIFAPVVYLRAFDDPQEAVGLVQRTGFGLSASVHTTATEVVDSLAPQLPVGILMQNARTDAVGLEAAFGGRRNSGNGWPEGGQYAYRAVTDLQVVYG
jgi:acyl-CoA reductase-like NAD-dependent aldehyde dehydrogenase